MYRKEIEDFVSRHQRLALAACIVVTVIRYVVPQQVAGIQLLTLESLLLFAFWLSYAIGAKSRFMNNEIMKYIGGISMEMYLAQMVAFRVIEKTGMLYRFGYGWLSFMIVMVLEVGLLIAGIEIWKLAKKIIQSHHLRS